MFTPLISLAIELLIVGAIGYVVYLFISWIPLPDVLKQIAYVLLGLILLLWLLETVFGISPGVHTAFPVR